MSSTNTRQVDTTYLPSEFLVPDLLSDCHYPLLLNQYCFPLAQESSQWLLAAAHHSPKRRLAFQGLKAGELTAACYPHAPASHLRVCMDFMNYLFNLDDWLDDFDVHSTTQMAKCCISAMYDPVGFETSKRAGLLTKSFFARFVELVRCPEDIPRFIYSMELFFRAVAQQSDDRAKGFTPDLESYIAVRRNTSGCKPCFVLISWANGLELPREVVDHPVFISMEDATNDLITWSNDIFSYNKEQAQNDTHNMISVIMGQRGLSLQEAVDYVGQLCRESIERFEADRKILPSWGEKIDQDVAVYVDGLQNWIIGSLHWSFDTERYFGKDGPRVKNERVVMLFPKRTKL